jgi:hypothetical protein
MVTSVRVAGTGCGSNVLERERHEAVWTGGDVRDMPKVGESSCLRAYAARIATHG